MTIVAVLLMSLGLSPQEPPADSGAPDSTRVAIAQAALEHAVGVARDDMGIPVERMFLSFVSWPRDQTDPREWWAGNDTVAYGAVAEEHGLDLRYISEHPAYMACKQSRRSAACQTLKGATSLSVLRAGVLESGHAYAWIQIRTIPAADGRGYSLYGQELRLEKVGGAWRVARVVQAIEG